MKNKIWLKKPEKHDYPAAMDYLTLHYNKDSSQILVGALKSARTEIRKAKDILRASSLPLLPKDNVHVRENLKKVKNGEKLSPVLLVRGDKLIIADGYHRVCAIYYLSEDLTIPCRIVG
jgi:hypothetical protein